MPRVVTGRFRGAVLQAPKGDKTRPTTDKVKEALFSIIQRDVPGSEFLDLCAGCGQIGIEAVSRGAVRATLVDKGGEPASMIARNLEKIRMKDSEAFRFYRMGVLPALEMLASKGEKFDIIFMDPPYRIVPDLTRDAAESICRGDLLNDDGMLIVEHAEDNPPLYDQIALEHVRSCSYGLTVLPFEEIDKGLEKLKAGKIRGRLVAEINKD